MIARSKYHAIRTEVDGITFASKAEAHRYQELRLLEVAGEISDLERQVAFHLWVGDEHICKYVADFRYVRGGETVVEDVKGVRTAAYVLKRKLMKACHGIDLLETS